jgi:hypothetical protein
MLPALVLAAAGSTATQFYDDFAGSWICGNATNHATWRIDSAPGDYWTTVVYGDSARPDGHAYVGYLEQEGVYVYNDYHADGSLARLTANPPSDHTWVWTGTYFPYGGAADDTPYISWKLLPNGTIARTFGKRVNGRVTELGSDTCRQAPKA